MRGAEPLPDLTQPLVGTPLTVGGAPDGPYVPIIHGDGPVHVELYATEAYGEGYGRGFPTQAAAYAAWAVIYAASAALTLEALTALGFTPVN